MITQSIKCDNCREIIKMKRNFKKSKYEKEFSKHPGTNFEERLDLINSNQTLIDSLKG